MKFAALIFVSILLLVAVAASPSAPQQVPSPKDVVAPTTYVSLDPVGRGSAFQIAVVLKIRPGFHVNAREKSEDYLIATDLRADAPPVFNWAMSLIPKGALHTFTFSKKPLNVYEDTISLRLPVTALANAPLGAQHIPLKLRYQACSTEICLPPVTLLFGCERHGSGIRFRVQAHSPRTLSSKVTPRSSLRISRCCPSRRSGRLQNLTRSPYILLCRRAPSGFCDNLPMSQTARSFRIWFILPAVLLAVILFAGGILFRRVRHMDNFVRLWVIRSLSQQFEGRVELRAVHVTGFPQLGVTGEDLAICISTAVTPTFRR